MIQKVVKLGIAALVTTSLAVFMAALPAGAAVNSAQAGSHGSAARVSGPADDATIANSPNTRSKICGAGDNTWVHMTINGSTLCYSGVGYTEFSGNVTGWFCAGNNDGVLDYLNSYDDPISFDFGPGTNTNLGGGDVTRLDITKTSGSNTCP